MSLVEARRGQQVRVTHIAGRELRAQLIRLGITEGCLLRCLEKIPLGPLMLGLNRQEIALGRAVAEKIRVEAGGAP